MRDPVTENPLQKSPLAFLFAAFKNCFKM